MQNRAWAASDPKQAIIPKMSSKEILAKYRDAVVKINIYEGLFPLRHGAGVFLTQGGVIATTFDAIEGGLKPGYSIEVVRSDGLAHRDVSISGCMEAEGRDFCLIKINSHPDAWVSTYNPSPENGEKITVIGHSTGANLSVVEGAYGGARDYKGTKVIQYGALGNFGNEGGPIFDSTGTFIGIVDFISKGRRNFDFGIFGFEVMNYLKRNQTFKPAAEFIRSRVQAETAKSEATWKQLSEYLAAAEKPAPSAAVAALLWPISFEVDGQKYQGTLPLRSDACERRGSKVLCSNEDASLVVTLSVENTQEKIIRNVGKVPEEPKASGISAKLAKTKGEMLYSRPSKLTCENIPSRPNDPSVLNGADFCSYSVQDQNGAWSEEDVGLLQQGAQVYRISLAYSRRSMAPLYQHLPRMIAGALVKKSR